MRSQATVLLTAASGLLGRALTDALTSRGLMVLAQHHSNPLEAQRGVVPLWGDLSTPAGVEAFWSAHRTDLIQVEYFFSNYGPITCQPTQEIEYGDLTADLTAHLAPLLFLTRRMRETGSLRGVMASGVEGVSSAKGYRTILPHACAKAAVEMVVRSWALVWPEQQFIFWPIPPLLGARVPKARGGETPPEKVAEAMVRALIDGR